MNASYYNDINLLVYIQIKKQLIFVDNPNI